MFAKRKKREYPPGTFVSTPKRIVAILQLCIVFTIVIAAGSYPFLGELFSHKSETLLYHNVMGNSVLTEKLGINTQTHKELLQRNSERFTKLPELQRTQIIHQYDMLQAKAEKPFWTKFIKSLRILGLELPPFERAWLLLSTIIAILILLRHKEAAKAAWLLPVLTLFFAVNNFTYGQKPQEPADNILFPTEKVILMDYLKEPLSSNILDQQQQLIQGWKLYLVREWAKQDPSDNTQVFNQQVEDGEYAFNVARLEILGANQKVPSSPYDEKKTPLTLTMYLIWNVLFAWVVNRKQKLQAVNA